MVPQIFFFCIPPHISARGCCCCFFYLEMNQVWGDSEWTLLITLLQYNIACVKKWWRGLVKENKTRISMSLWPSVQTCHVLLWEIRFWYLLTWPDKLICFGDLSTSYMAQWALIWNTGLSVTQTAATCRGVIKVWHRLALQGARIDSSEVPLRLASHSNCLDSVHVGQPHITPGAESETVQNLCFVSFFAVGLQEREGFCFLLCLLLFIALSCPAALHGAAGQLS